MKNGLDSFYRWELWRWRLVIKMFTDSEEGLEAIGFIARTSSQYNLICYQSIHSGEEWQEWVEMNSLSSGSFFLWGSECSKVLVSTTGHYCFVCILEGTRIGKESTRTEDCTHCTGKNWELEKIKDPRPNWMWTRKYLSLFSDSLPSYSNWIDETDDRESGWSSILLHSIIHHWDKVCVV